MLKARLAGLLAKRQIFAWYWGHEHRCVLFDDDPASGLHGRCVGHSGYPYFRQPFDDVNVGHRASGHVFYRFAAGGTSPGALVLDGENPYVKGHEAEYGPNGYMTLEFTARQMHETVHAADGTPLWDRTLP